MTTTTIPDGAACYFCLGEEADDEGMPLLRDCSCRGDSGFAHLSCLTKYAEQKCKQAPDGDISTFSNPWNKCNNCKQPFQGRLSIDLVSAFVEFAEATYGHEGNSKWDKMKVMESLRLKIDAVSNKDVEELVDKLMPIIDQTKKKYEVIKVETESIVNHLLTMVDQTKKDLKMSGWIHMPKGSEEYEYYSILCGNYEAFAHVHLATMIMLSGDTSEESMKTMITHYKKARALSNLVGATDEAKDLDTLISLHTAEKQTGSDQNINSSLATRSVMQSIKNNYENNVIQFGMDSIITIQSGLHHAADLWENDHCIEAERVVTKLTIVSRRVLGPHHKLTIEADEFLKKCKQRSVIVLPQNKHFQALRYENDGEICVITGPVAMPRNLEDERVYHVDSHLVIPNNGCPVLCHGLVSASHLNGELGEVRNWKNTETGIRFAVYFEKKGAKSALVKPENLRIAFELPISSKD
jgi:hypothetical protein